MSKKFRVLSGVNVELFTIAMYDSKRVLKVDSKALNAEHVISY